MKPLSLAVRFAAIAAIAFAAYLLVEPRATAQQDITLGAVFPLSGDIASYGKAAQQGIDLAVDDINRAGGVNNRKLRIVYEDSRGQAADAVSAIRKLIEVNRPPIIFGEAASSVTLAIAPIANSERVVLITPISSSKELTEKGGAYFFRVCPSDVVQARLMADWIISEGHKSVAIIYVNNSWGDGLRQEFITNFTKAGGQVVLVEGIRDGDRDIRTPLTKVKASGATALYAITYGREGGALLRQAKELGLNLQIYGADVWGSPELRDTAGEAANGVKIIVPAQFKGPAYEAFAKAFKAKYGANPDVYAAYSYDMVHIAAIGLAKADRGAALRDAIRAVKYDGVTGPTQFDMHGDVIGKGFARITLQ